MGIFSRFCSSVSSFVSSTVSAVKTVYEKGKEVAAKVLTFIADDGAKLVQNVKDVWQMAKPFLEKIQVVAKMVKKIPGVHPWITLAAEAIDRGLTALFALENSPVLKKIAAGVEWAIAAARVLSEKWLNQAEMAQAEERKRAFAEAADSLNDEQRRAVLFAQIVNQLLLVRSHLKGKIEGAGVASFHHYLRLRATQKLLVDVNGRVNGVRELEDITADDLFLLEIGQELLAENPVLSDFQLKRLEVLVSARYGKELEPFVFEELVRGWAMVLNEDQKTYETELERLSFDEAVLLRLQGNQSQQLDLSPAEQNQLAQLQGSIPGRQRAVQALVQSIRHRNHFIDSAEGLLQVLEGTADEAVIESIPEVGRIIIGCMEKGQQWEMLGEVEKCLVIDFANYFRKARVKRGRELEEETRAMTLVEVAA
jgi:hypothetical protein